VLVEDLLLMFSDLHEALAVCLVCGHCYWAVASPGDGPGTVVGVAAWLVPFGNEVSEGKAGKSEKNYCWSHDERLLVSERLGVECEVKYLVMVK
jgi:hypothetical protein